MSVPRSALPMPPMEIRLMQDDDDRLLSTGADLARLMFECGLTETSSLLDVGSCYARLPLGLLSATDYRGRYTGFDVLPKQVAWCRANVTPAFPRYRFHHLDVRNDRYNPRGTTDPLDVRFPREDASVDVISLFSIFTHFYRADIEHYLGEFARVLRPGGRAVTTWFLFDDERLPRTTSAGSTYPMTFVLDDVTRYNDADDPLRAIAFHEDAVRAWVAAAGLEVERVDRGSWCGEPGRIFQDLVVLRRPLTPADRVRSLRRRVVRRVRRLTRGRVG